MSAPNNPSPTLPQGIDPSLVRQIRLASQSTSTDFGLLMAQAAQESDFNPNAKASGGSSAAGLYQFTDSTWLDMVHRFGAAHGVGDLAQQIKIDGSGQPQVADAAMRQHILALRSDPQLSSALAGEYAHQNAGELEHALGHTVSRTDVYMAHFLGAGGATTFLKALDTNGSTPAASLLPEAAASNRSIFFDSDSGRARSVAEIYHALDSRIEKVARAAEAIASAAFSPGTAANATTGASSPTEFSAAQTAGAASVPASRGPLGLAGLKLTAPVAAMLDIVALAALKLVGGGKAPAAQPVVPAAAQDRHSA